ncbi:sodium:proton antiporter [Oscillatoria amoena NRMC-F 0135]|nr:sodium:proton antiporter [Geitlerinema splendidum]MDL5050025.1 sodium:proton antiporter [Oscillatoria amoena NRMC-F 0135]
MVDTYILDLLIIGLLLLTVTLGSGWIARLPLSYALIYLCVGIFLGPYGTGLISLTPNAEFIERITELVVIISVFSCGLKMNRPFKPWAWQITARLIGFLMPLCIIAIAAVSHWLIGLDWGPSILLGAILAPTDPVLASEVQLAHVEDRDELRFGLTSESGLNDALAFPFVYFGLHLIENPAWSEWFRQWVAIDLFWAIGAGIVMGFVVAKGIVWIERRLQSQRPADEIMEDFIALSTILLTYSLTEIINGYGFLAVFVAGVTVQASYYHEQTKRLHQLEFIERLEKLLEIGTILLLGTLLRINPILHFGGQALIATGFLLFAIRPLGTWLSTLGHDCSQPSTRWLMGWFGIRGVGSLYYLGYALGQDLPPRLGEQLTWITCIVILISIVLHGITATPLMRWYRKHGENRNGSPVPETD